MGLFTFPLKLINCNPNIYQKQCLQSMNRLTNNNMGGNISESLWMGLVAGTYSSYVRQDRWE